MEGQAGRAEDRMAPATAFHMILAQLNPAVGTFLAGHSRAGIADRIRRISYFYDFADAHFLRLSI